MNRYPRLIPLLAFLAGVAITLGFKDVYPDLERRFRRRRRENNASRISNRGTHVGDKLNMTENAVMAEADLRVVGTSMGIVQGIEGCIGNTPLIRIKSLSEATGCEILAKAEVRLANDGSAPSDYHS